MEEKQRKRKKTSNLNREQSVTIQRQRVRKRTAEAERPVRKKKVQTASEKRVRTARTECDETRNGQVRRTEEAKKKQVRKTYKHKKRQRKNRFIKFIPWILVIIIACIVVGFIANFSEAKKMNNKGLEAYEAADYETANTYFAKAIERDSLNGTYYMNRGMALSELKMYDDAMTSFERASELLRGDEDIQLLYRSKGISLVYQGNYSEAITSFDAALAGKEKRFTNTEIDILYYKAEAQDKAEKYVDAAMTYTTLVEEEGSADAYMLRGMEYIKVGDYSSAESDLRMAIKKDKKNYDIYMALYQALSSQGKMEEAKEVLQEALKLGGNKGTALVSQGEIYLKLGDFESAEAKFTKALDKKEITANLGMAELYMEKTEPDYASAVQYFETYIASVTDDADAYNKYGLCLIAMENYDKAEEIFTKGVALNDRLMTRTLSKNQIVAAEKAGHWEHALEYVDIYLQKYSDDADAMKEKEFIETRVR